MRYENFHTRLISISRGYEFLLPDTISRKISLRLFLASTIKPSRDWPSEIIHSCNIHGPLSWSQSSHITSAILESWVRARFVPINLAMIGLQNDPHFILIGRRQIKRCEVGGVVWAITRNAMFVCYATFQVSGSAFGPRPTTYYRKKRGADLHGRDKSVSERRLRI